MKKIIAVLLSVCMFCSAAACGKSENDTVSEENHEPAEGMTESTDEPLDTESKILVAYFSATNTTKGVAEYLAEGLNGELYAIIPEEPYTEEDLDYNNTDSRTSVEMNDPDARPAISGTVENMGQYDVVFLGYPIWWGEAPRIINTFLESYDFSGKVVIPFCTSGGSGIDSSTETLKTLAPDAVWADGHRFDRGASKESIMEWADSLDEFLYN